VVVAARCAAGLGGLLVLVASRTASADETTAARRAAAAREMGMPYTMAQLGAGLLALPAADVCPTSLDQCDSGETSIAFGLQNMYRMGPFGIGAGIVWATTLRGDAARGAAELEREHSRRYFLVEGLFRYYALKSSEWEWWIGSTFGAVIVNDSWSVKADRDPPEDTAFVGPRAVKVGTEGLAAGIAGGAEWSFADNWAFGTHIRYSNWLLPSEPESSPTEDIASLSGRVDMFDFGLSIAYLIAL
jgi:hypothetical protein